MTQFITNREETLLERFKNTFKNQEINRFYLLVGFFYFSEYKKIKPYLKETKEIRILVGMDYCNELKKEWHKNIHEKNQVKENKKKLKNELDELKERKSCYFEKSIADINNCDIGEGEEIKEFFQDIKKGKTKIKIHPSRNLHAKIYLFLPKEEDFNQGCLNSALLTGSSNLTESGLKKNYEFNVLLRDYQDVVFAESEFNLLWEESEQLSYEDLEKNIYEKTHLKTPTTEEIYYKLLYEYFTKERIEIDPDIEVPRGYKKLTYQVDAVQQAQWTLKKHNGLFLADVVGLGKTLITAMIVNEYKKKNYNNDPYFKVLVICPPPLIENWQETFKEFPQLKEGNYKVKSAGEIHKIEEQESYMMIIVDEVHRFKNKDSQSYQKLKKICKCRHVANQQKKIILLSATPLNNHVKELQNEIELFQELKNSTLDSNLESHVNLQEFFKEKVKELNQYRKEQKEKNISKKVEIANLFGEVRESVLKSIMIRRTRKGLESSKEYKKDLLSQGIQFPNIKTQNPIFYQMPEDLNSLYDETLIFFSKENQKFHYARYKILTYLKENKKKEIQSEMGNRKIEDFSKTLTGIIRTLLLKRMDSSFVALCQTLKNTIKSYEGVLKMYQKDEILINPKIKNINEFDFDTEDDWDKVLEKFKKDEKTKEFKKNDFDKKFIQELQEDKKKLEQLLEKWQPYQNKEKDKKWQTFLQKINDEILKNSSEKKLVIFSENKATTNYLKKCFEAEENFTNKILAIDSSNAKQQQQIIKENFDANFKKQKNEEEQNQEQKNYYDIIITTEVLAEGVNLHRSNVIINYDIPWNSTRLIQRIGRVNRIGSKAKEIYIYNFAPCPMIEDNLKLEETAKMKLAAFHSALGEDSAIYSQDEDVQSHDFSQEEEIDAEQEYLEEIRNLKKDDKDEYQKIAKLSVKINNTVQNEKEQNNTVVFLRTQDKESSRFYKVKNGKANKINFIQCAELLKSSKDKNFEKKNVNKEHIDLAREKFKSDIETQLLKKEHDKKTSPQENNVLSFLKSILSNVNNSSLTQKDFFKTDLQKEDFIQKLKNCMESIQNKTMKDLLKNIIQIKKNNQNLQKTVKEISIVMEKYNNDFITEEQPNQQKQIQSKEKKNQEKQIILAQGYSI